MDIVERLRKAQQTFYGDTSINELHMYAADEIERLRDRVKELATALEFEANYDGHIALARSALQQKESE